MKARTDNKTLLHLGGALLIGILLFAGCGSDRIRGGYWCEDEDYGYYFCEDQADGVYDLVNTDGVYSKGTQLASSYEQSYPDALNQYGHITMSDDVSFPYYLIPAGFIKYPGSEVFKETFLKVDIEE